MVRKAFKGLGWLILALLLALALFAAFNWTLVNNMRKLATAKASEVEKISPVQWIKGCKAGELAADPAALPAETFAEMKAFSDKHQGIGLIVLVDGKIAGEAYRPGASTATRTMSQSMNKGVTALMMGAAINDGLIKSVDDPIGNYLDEWKGQERGNIKLRDFLSMSSGIHNPSMAKFEMAAMNLTLGDVSDAALGLQVERKPGTFSYANANTQIAGMAISRALKRAKQGSYADYLANKLWCPLGNADATLFPDGKGEPRYYAFLEASVRDWARVGELVRNKGKWGDQQLIPASWIEEVTKPSAANPNFGMNFWRGSPWKAERRYSKDWDFSAKHSAPYLADDVIFLDGFGGQRTYIVPSAKLVIARSGETSMTWDDAILVNLALKGMATTK